MKTLTIRDFELTPLNYYIHIEGEDEVALEPLLTGHYYVAVYKISDGQDYDLMGRKLKTSFNHGYELQHELLTLANKSYRKYVVK